MSKNQWKNKNVVFGLFIFVAIVLLPILNSFLGIDMVDTGYYLYQYEAPLSDYGVYTSFLANLIGAVWLKIFGGLGLWGLNILEILLEWLQCFIVYQTLKTVYGRKNVLIGCAVSMLLISTYVNIFNYHQLNMFLCTLMLCFMYTGLRNENKWLFLGSGFAGMAAIFCRMPSILGLLCFACIVYWGWFIKKEWKKTLQYIGLFFLGYVVMAFVILGFLKCLDVVTHLNILERVLNEVLRLNTLGKNGGAAYGSSAMISNFITDNFHAVCAALLFIICIFVILFAAQWKYGKKSILKNIIFGLLCIAILPVLWLAVYKVGEAPAFIQLTSFNWFIYGMCLTISMVYILLGMFSKNKEYGWSGLVSMMSMALILLCCTGSAARLKHTILGMWFIVPLGISQCKSFYKKEILLHIGKRAFAICKKAKHLTLTYYGIIFSLIVVAFVAGTNNFDAVNRLELTSSINSCKVRFLKTTEREADATNEILDVLEQYKDRPLMVLGNAVIIYYLADMESYVKPWVSGTSYTVDDFSYHLESEIQWENKDLPIIVWSRTNPYEGFSKEKYEDLLEKETNNSYSGKREVTEQFMKDFKYKVIFENDYFTIYDTDMEE